MLVERLTFHAKYGQGDALVAVIREFARLYASEFKGANLRLYTDQTGKMFTITWDTEHRDLRAFAEFEERSQALFARADWQGWFAKMQPLVEDGERQLLNSIDL